MTQLQRFIHSHRGGRHVKKLLRGYRRRMEQRTAAECRHRWAPYGGVEADLLRELASIHELPNAHIYPTDRALLFFVNPYMDLREVETLRALEEHSARELSPEVMAALDSPRLRYVWQLLGRDGERRC